MKKVEFHIHTKDSKDSLQSNFLLKIMLKVKKIECIVITDHNEIKNAQLIQKKYKNHFEVIVGEEIFTTEGEIIGLFLTERIMPNLSPEETVSKIKEQGGLVYIPHPYDEKRKKTVLTSEALERIIEYVDLIESYNGRNIVEEYGIKQNNIVKRYKKVRVLGSDAHEFFELGRNYMMIEKITKDEIVESIKNGVMYQKKCIKIAHFWTAVVKRIKKVF